VPISWDEALDTIAVKLRSIIEVWSARRIGYPKWLRASAGRHPPVLHGYFSRVPRGLGSGGPWASAQGRGVKCTHSEHLYGEFWHRAFTVCPDTPMCNYVISCGANSEASGGVVGVWRHANARERGMKRVQVEPHLSITGACSAEWVR